MKIGDSTKNLSGEQGLSEEKTKSDKPLLTDDQLDSAEGGIIQPPYYGAVGKGFAGAEEKGKAGKAGLAEKAEKQAMTILYL